ncbi:hypothetical protein TSOC_008091 [Tetrabaena socialis]|uniref:Ankyrin repeat domain-containing protein n=1 Tax=Tetrabaena socialis TaxID=47790 RepID=A0A2J7ZZA9_9CHLO|nr:hypothetical protein TSOC_008091 [Tetrabaena socialis]|eukprot:PNH05614.1 hypothetical protein TSOC_008091 [Tetrabaena socialis]
METSSAMEMSTIWSRLPRDMVLEVLARLPGGEVACTARLVDKAAALAFRGQRHVRLSEPSPPHAFARWFAGSKWSLTLQQRHKLLALTSCSGNVENLSLLFTGVGCSLPPQVLAAAAAAGQLEICQWLLQRDCAGQQEALEAAACAGHRLLVEWLLSNGGCHLTTAAVCAAARGGQVALMDRLNLQLQLQPLAADDGVGAAGRKNAQDSLGNLLEAAASGCDLATLQRLHAAHPPGDGCCATLAADDARQQQQQPALPLREAHRRRIVTAAAASPTADWQAKVEWLPGRGYPLRTADCSALAALPDAAARCAWLRARGVPLRAGLATEAARAGNVEALSWLLAEGVGVEDGEAVLAAASAGQLGALQALHAHGCAFPPDSVCAAARSGSLPTVAWLVEVLASQQAGQAGQQHLTPLVFSYAVMSGCMELLAWLRQRRCPWDAAAVVLAAQAGSEEMLEWLAAQGSPMPAHNYMPYVVAGQNGDLATMACLKRLGCYWSRAAFEAAVWHGCEPPVLRWLLDAGCPADLGRAAAVAAKVRAGSSAAAWIESEQQRSAGVAAA